MENKNEKIARDDSDVIFEDDNYLVVNPYSPFSANYFISKEKFNKDHFMNFVYDKKYYIIVDKKKQGKIWGLGIYNNERDYPYIKNEETGAVVDLNDLIEEVKPIENIINGLFGDGKIYDTFLKFVNGINVTEREFRNCDALIYDVRPVKRLPGASKVIIRFTESEYLDLFNLSDDDKYFALSYLSRSRSYSSWTFGSHDRSWEEFREGYIFRDFNNENLEKLAKIASYVTPEIERDITINNDVDDLSILAKQIYNLYETKADKIMYEWASMMDECFENTASSVVREDLCGVLNKYGFFQKEGKCYSEFFTTITNILSLYNNYPKNLDLSQLLKMKLAETYDRDFFNWEEVKYGDCYHKFYDSESFHLNIGIILDDILEEIEESDLFEDIKEYNRVRSEIMKKFEFGRWYELPKDADKLIQFININPTNNKVSYNFINKRKGDGIKKSESTLEDINLLLYHPEIEFENL